MVKHGGATVARSRFLHLAEELMHVDEKQV